MIAAVLLGFPARPPAGLKVFGRASGRATRHGAGSAGAGWKRAGRRPGSKRTVPFGAVATATRLPRALVLRQGNVPCENPGFPARRANPEGRRGRTRGGQGPEGPEGPGISPGLRAGHPRDGIPGAQELVRSTRTLTGRTSLLGLACARFCAADPAAT